MTPSLYGAAAPPEEQRKQLRRGEIPIAVYGLGKMGLPLAAVYAENTGNVTGVDIDQSVVDRINDGECHVQGEPGLDPLVRTLVSRDALRATTDGRSTAEAAAVHVIVVPTLIDDEKQPDLSAVESVITDVAAGLSAGDMVVLESTLPPRATVDVIRPLLVEKSGLDLTQFGIAVCPERTSSGQALADIRGTHPKVVGGDDVESGRVASLLYEQLVDNEVIEVADTTTAEAVKVFEGLYRDANIALANDLAQLTDELEIDVRDAIQAANTQPYCDIHTPGPGVGGHCIPYYPYFVLNWLEGETPTLATAREVNDEMPGFVVDRAAEGLAADESSGGPDSLEDATVAVLGLTYRAGVRETRASPGVDIVEELAERGATVLAADPLVDAAGLPATDVTLEELPDHDLDAAVLATSHDEFDAVDWDELDPMIVVDGHDVLDLGETDHQQYTVGSGWQ